MNGMSATHESSIINTSMNIEQTLDTEMARLARLLIANAPNEGLSDSPISGMYIARYSNVAPDFIKTFYLPSLGIVVQGAKSITVGLEAYQLVKCQMMMHPVALPVALKVINASKSEPLLTVRLDLDPQRIAELVLKVYPHGLPPVSQWRAGYVVNADSSIINAVTRLLECLTTPGEIELLGPLIMEKF